MHSDDTSWKFKWKSGLSKCLVVLQYLSRINKLQIIYCSWTIFFVCKIEIEFLEKITLS